MGPRVFAPLVVCLSAALYLSPLLLDAPLTDPDEGLHAAISQEMSERGDLVVPRLLGRAFLDKPILFFWVQAASIKAFGPSTAAARLPGMLLALLGIATTGWLAFVLFATATGWIAAACYATMALPFLLAQAPVHDVALVPFTNLALGWLWRSGRRSRDSVFPLDLALAALALGLSILTKGFEGVAMVGLGYGLYLLATRQITFGRIGQGMATLVIAVAIAAPWYVAMEAREPGYLRYYFVDRHVLGFATDTQRHGGQPWWYYLPLVAAGGLPWILYTRPWTSRSSPNRAGAPDLLLWAFVAGSLVLLSLSGSKAVTYVLPVMPAIAILAARSWGEALAARGASSGVGTECGEALRGPVILHTALFIVIAAATPWGTRGLRAQQVTAGEALAFGAMSAVWLWLLLSRRRGAVARVWGRLVIATGATCALAFTLLGPPLAQAHSARDLAAYFNTMGRLPPRIYVMDGRVSFVYYLRPDLRGSLTEKQVQSVSVEQLDALPAWPDDAVVVLPADLAGRLERVHSLVGATRRPAGRYVVVGP